MGAQHLMFIWYKKSTWFIRPSHVFSLLCCLHAYLGIFSRKQGSAWTFSLVCSYAGTYTASTLKQCENRHLSITDRIYFFSNLCSNSSFVGLNQTCEPWKPMTLSPVHRLFFLGPLLEGTKHYIPGTFQKTCFVGQTLTQSSHHHNFGPIFKASQIHMLSHCFCFQHISFENRLFTCCLIHPIPWQVPVERDNQCYSPH